MSNEKTGNAAATSRAATPTRWKQILSILCQMKFLLILRMGRRYLWTEHRQFFTRRWQRPRNAIGR